MAFNVSALTRPTSRKLAGEGADGLYIVQWGCVLAAVILNYTAGAGGDRSVGIEVYDPSGNLVGSANSEVMTTGGTTQRYDFCLGSVQDTEAVGGVVHANLPTIPMWEGYTVRIAASGYTLPSDDTVDMTVHMMR